MISSIATISHLSKSFPFRRSLFSRDAFVAVDDVSLVLRRGRTLALVGESGSGKSTIARLLMKLDTPSAGSIVLQHEGRAADIADIPAREYYRRVQMVFQDPYSSINPRKRVWQTVSSAPSHLGRLGRAALRDIAARGLEEVGLGTQYLDAYPDALSGGQRQRVCIARALALRPEILVLDEPLSSLDVSVQAQIVNLLLALQQRLGLTYLFISHDLAVVRHLADEVAVLRAGRLVECGGVENVIDVPRAAYTRTLVRSALGDHRASRLQPAGEELRI